MMPTHMTTHSRECLGTAVSHCEAGPWNVNFQKVDLPVGGLVSAARSCYGSIVVKDCGGRGWVGSVRFGRDTGQTSPPGALSCVRDRLWKPLSWVWFVPSAPL